MMLFCSCMQKLTEFLGMEGMYVVSFKLDIDPERHCLP